MKITIASYKPDSYDSCMGHVVASYSSDFRFETFTSEAEASEHIANLDSQDFGVNERGFDHKIILAPSVGESFLTEEQEEYMMVKILSAAEFRRGVIVRQKQEKLIQFRLEEDRRAATIRKEQELRKYEELKAKFGK